MAIDTITVASAEITDGSIATADIADDAVTSAKLDTNIAVAGTLGVTGAITGTSQTLTKSGNVALFLNRTGSGTDDDGDIVQISNADGLVGAIGSSTNTEITFAGKDCGLGVVDHALVPTQGDGLLYRNDNEVDLGMTATRFKDIYISGGLYVGGTASANKLDDYEEGTWTPSIQNGWGILNPTTSTATGHYTKIGNLVYVLFKIVLNGGSTNSNPLVVAGLPFSHDGTTGGSGVYDTLHGSFASANSNATNVFGEVGNNGATAIIFKYRGATGLNNFTGTDSGNSGNFTFSGIYRTDS